MLGEGSGLWQGAFLEQNKPKAPDVSGDSLLCSETGAGQQKYKETALGLQRSDARKQAKNKETLWTQHLPIAQRSEVAFLAPPMILRNPLSDAAAFILNVCLNVEVIPPGSTLGSSWRCQAWSQL